MRLSDGQIGKAIADILVIVDTREQKNQHILDFLTSKGIPFKVEKLDTADYSFVLPNNPDLGMDKKILVEKKNSLDEIVGNFTKDRDRFTREFERVKPDEKIHLVIEKATWKKIFSGSWRSQMPPQSFTASLLTFCIRYNCPVWFTDPAQSGEVIYNIMKYELMEHLKKNSEKGLTS